MKKLYICSTQSGLKSRFIENLKLCDVLYQEVNSNEEIYKYFLTGVKNYLVSTDMVDNNLIMFAKDKGKEVKIFIDHTIERETDKLILELLTIDSVVHLIDNTEAISKNYLDVSGYVNPRIFFSDQSNDRQNIAAVFLSGVNSIPFNLLKNLETKNLDFKVRLFDNHMIKNKYNVGLLSEQEKANILKKYKYYININNLYLREALLCGAEVLNFENLNSIEIPQSLTSSVKDIHLFLNEML